MVVNQEQILAHIHNRESTEPIVIPEPAKLLKDADERIVPNAISAVQHGCQRLVVMSNDTDKIMRILHFTHTLVRDNLRKPLGQVWGKGEEIESAFPYISSGRASRPCSGEGLTSQEVDSKQPKLGLTHEFVVLLVGMR